MELPEVEVENVDILLGYAKVELNNYKSHPPIKAPLSN